MSRLTPDGSADVGGATLAVVRGTRELVAGPLPADVATVAKQCLLDWLGVTLAGAGEPLVDILADELVGPGNGSVGSGGESTLIGRPGSAPAPTAALVNGSAGHALDFDDMHMAMIGHPSVPVAPAVLALGERLDAPGERILTALVAGIEAECRVALLVNPSHYARGWHATATTGTFGAAAACATLLDLGEDAWLQAFGIAGTQAAGLKSVFGTMCKPLHAGKAATNGLLAATLAARGFTSRPDILEAHQGFGPLHSDEVADAGVVDAVAGRHLTRETLFKYHAACYLTHAAIDAALVLRDRHGLRPDDVDAIDVRVARGVLDVANIATPRTGLEGKFSLRATVAMALLGDDTADPDAYTDARMGESDLVALLERVTVIDEDRCDLAAASVSVRTRDGDRLDASADTSVPAADLAEQGERLAAKFDRLASPALGDVAAAELRALVERLETLASVRELTAACQVDRTPVAQP